VLAQNGVLTFRQAERILTFRADAENLVHLTSKVHWFGSVTPRSPNDPRSIVKPARHRIVRAHEDIAVVQQETIHERASRACAASLSISIGSSVKFPLVITRHSSGPSNS